MSASKRAPVAPDATETAAALNGTAPVTIPQQLLKTLVHAITHGDSIVGALGYASDEAMALHYASSNDAGPELGTALVGLALRLDALAVILMNNEEIKKAGVYL